MRVYNLNNGMFLGNVQYLMDKYSNKDVYHSIKHLKNPIIIISLSTTLSEKMFNTKLLPLAINDENYEIIKK